MSSVCHDCIGDEFLAAEVKIHGRPDYCKYCGTRREAIQLDRLADRVHDVIQEHFRFIPDEPDDAEGWFLQRLGRWPPLDTYLIADVVTDLVGGKDEFVRELIRLMSDTHDPQVWDYKDSLDTVKAYDLDSHYQALGPDDTPFQNKWHRFTRDIQSQARFFSVDADTMLQEIFGDLATLQSFGDRPVVRRVGPSDKERFVWRARVAYSHTEVEKILKSPTSQLGPPPSRWKDGSISPPGGRMNAPGVSVFYGASNLDTCEAEVRAPVGGYVVAARFELLRDVRLLDLDVLESVYATGSYFDPDLGERAGRAVFLRRLANLISQPVMPQDEATEYLATQAIAEFLANRQQPRLDGIIFRSSQSRGDGRNTVLFNHARIVEPYTQPHGTDTWVYIPSDVPGDGRDDEIRVIERRPLGSTNRTTDEPANASSDDALRLNLLEVASDRPTLALDLESVVVLEIQGVEYAKKCRSVRWDPFETSR